MFPDTFSHCILKNFRSLNPPKDNETQATVGIVFHGTTAIAELPQNDVVAQTLVEALNNSTNISNLSINPASVKVLASPVPDPITTAPPTTTPSTATTTPAAPEPTYILSAEFKEVAFSPALTDSNSDEYKALETAALNACNNEYRSMFPNTFSHCILKNFRSLNPPKDNETQATVGIVFHGTTAIAELPQNYVVAQTLVEALNNSTNIPNLSINPASVKVLASPVPDPITTAPPTTTPSTATTTPAAHEPTYILSAEFKEVAFSPALTDSNSDEYKALETAALNACNNKYRSMFPDTFSHCILKNFRSLNPPKDNETQATVGIVFHGTTAIAELPQNDVVAQTLVEALNNSTNISNLSINPASVKVLASPVPDPITTAPPTTTPSTATTTPAAPEPTYILSAEFKEVAFSPALTDSNSDEYKALETAALNACNNEYRSMFPNTFSHCILKNFSALNPPKDNETQATVGVVFHGTTAIAELPQNDVVAQTLVEALSNSTNIPILSINPASVKVLASPVPYIITTDAPATTPTAAATNTAAPDHSYVLDIQLIGEPFSPALTNTSSKEYKALEKRILNACGEIYRKTYPKTFSHCLLKEFRASNVTRVTETRATFEAVFHGNTSYADLPMNSAVIKEFVLAVNNSNNAFNLSINPTSVMILDSPVEDPITTDAPATTPACGEIYRTKYPKTFSHCLLKEFRQSSDRSNYSSHT
ncbi:mucin-5AC-like [Trematomus bernacchii]|uniref:mucin-5AC-like n=1 Tax=Trematomus bernacchii TaxID=40690 RepID=UPI00146B87FB|nr:mucin-5AC-like [Trematomus bernacchii]